MEARRGVNVPGLFPLISREDLSTRLDGYDRAARRAEILGSVGVVGGLAIGVGLVVLRGILGWPEHLDAVFFASGWALAIGSAALAWWGQRRALATYQLPCPACHAPMLTTRPWGSDASPGDLTVLTGICPHCRARICD